jgi:DNA-directed RNA polymerase specialized sigma24 family protein
MSQSTNEARLRSLIRYHYQRNKHLTPVYDVDDLLQDAWIDLHGPGPPGAEPDQQPDADDSSEQALRQAVGRAADRAFGTLRKRCQRGLAEQVPLEFDPASCLPDLSLVLDLKQQIESLPDDERLVIEMLWSGYDGTEIAARLRLSPQAVTRRKQRALQRLRVILGPVS